MNTKKAEMAHRNMDVKVGDNLFWRGLHPPQMADVQKIREKLGVHLDFPKKVRKLTELLSDQ
jgi:hypothetical protein